MTTKAAEAAPVQKPIDVIAWLLEGDPAIRWQTLRDLQDASARRWQAERRKTLAEGWGARLLEKQAADGIWGGGIYSPKWTSSTYTLLMLCAIGIPNDHKPAQKGAAIVLDSLLGPKLDDSFRKRLFDLDQCITGMCLQLAAYFGIDDARVDAIVENLLAEMMPDGAWNCRHHRKPLPHHSSFNTTLNVLDGLREWLERVPKRRLRTEVLAAEHSALGLLLEHHLYKSDKSGKDINPKFKLLSHPPRWHYDAFRGLAYFARARAERDPRLQDAIDLLVSGRRADGTWPVQYKYSGKVYFEMESVGKPSRWNTLRALRVMKWWQDEGRG